MVVIGIDIGTTGTKALVVDDGGKIRGRGYFEYPVISPQPDWAEQNAEDWWNTLLQAVHKALHNGKIDPREVSAISLSTQGASMVAIDADCNPICPVITWMDTRAKSEAQELTSTFGTKVIHQKTGWMPSAVLDAAKILWLRRNKPDIYSKAQRFVTTLEFINQRLTGSCVIDPTNAGIRQLYNIKNDKWDPELLNFTGIGVEKLPQIAPSGAFIGTLKKTAAKALGLSETVRVYNGAHDQYCAAIGSGATRPEDTLIATGTAWVVFGLTGNRAFENVRFSPGIFPYKRGFAALASVPCGGASLKWWKNICGEEYQQLDNGVETRKESAKKLFFLPYLTGNENKNKIASFNGISLAHDKYDLARAIMEGVAFEARILAEEFRTSQTGRVIMAGGAAKSPVWRQITAEILGCEVIVPKEADAACLGAAILAVMGEKWFTDLDSCVKTMVHYSQALSPDVSAVEFYQNKFIRYNQYSF